MQPHNDSPVPSDNSRGQLTPPARDYSQSHDAVARLTRDQIDAIYAKQAQAEANLPSDDHDQSIAAEQAPPQAAAPASQPSVYDRTHSATESVNAADWQQYHSSWQQYYQKYYEGYYVGAVKDAHERLRQHAEQLQRYTAQTAQTPEPATVLKNEAMQGIRSELLTKVQHQAKKVRASRHFVPIVSALAVLVIFVFLQYNSLIIAYASAYISPGSAVPQDIIVDPNTSTVVGPDPLLIIPKIGITIPVDYNAKPDYDSQMAAMKDHVAYFGIPGANSRPGQFGNVPIAGHSSNDFTDTGAAKFIFTRLEQLNKGDTFYLNYKGTRYTYTVTRKIVVAPTDVQALQIGDDKPMATLITCVPLGTANSRLLVFGEQISPAPSTATKPSTSGPSSTSVTEMTGKSPTLLERAFGAR